MCTNFVFALLIYFFNPDTARMALEQIDLLFTNPDKGPVELSKELAKEKRKHGNISIVANTGAMKHADVVGEASRDKIGFEQDHIEKG